MGGIVGGTPQSLTILNSTIAAGSSVKLADVTVDNAIFADLIVQVGSNASASDGIEVWLVKVVGSDVADNKYSVLSIGPNESKKLLFSLEPGVYELWAKNNDATYDGGCYLVELKLYTYQA